MKLLESSSVFWVKQESGAFRAMRCIAACGSCGEELPQCDIGLSSEYLRLGLELLRMYSGGFYGGGGS